MKPLWWRRLLLGADIKSGAIWEMVSDQTSLLPIEKMEARFGKVQTAKPAETETAQATQVIRISAVHERELRLLPPPDEVGRSLMDLDDRLALDELERIQLLAPSAKDLEALRQAQQNIGWLLARFLPCANAWLVGISSEPTVREFLATANICKIWTICSPAFNAKLFQPCLDQFYPLGIG